MSTRLEPAGFALSCAAALDSEVGDCAEALWLSASAAADELEGLLVSVAADDALLASDVDRLFEHPVIATGIAAKLSAPAALKNDLREKLSARCAMLILSIGDKMSLN